MNHYILLLAILQLCNGLNILVFNPSFGHSHMKFMGRIADTLAAAGHNVTEVVPLVSPEEYTKVSQRTTIHKVPEDPRVRDLHIKARAQGGFFRNVWTMEVSPAALKEMTRGVEQIFKYSCERTIEETELWDRLKQQKFDLGLTEAFDFTGHGLFEMLGVNVTITVSSAIMWDHLAMMTGVPVIPSYVPGGATESTEKMSMLERADNALGAVMGSSIYFGIAAMQTDVFRQKVRPDFPDIKDLVGQSSMVITNSLPYLDFPHPLIHKVIELGGIGINDHKPLDKEWSDLLDKKKQTVLISFGSVARSKEMPKEMKEGVINTVKRLPEVQFIWKYEADDLTDLPSNLLLSKWTPQSDLLADDRLSLFVTHGGLASATEIAYGGTPAIVIPLFADQPRNAQMLKRHGVAESITKFEIVHPDKLYEVITKMLNDPSYKEKAKNLAEIVNNVPFTPKEVLVKNVEFVGRFGRLPQLDPYGRQLTFAQYFLLDVAAVVLAVVTVLLLVSFLIVNKLISCFSVQKMKPKRA